MTVAWGRSRAPWPGVPHRSAIVVVGDMRRVSRKRHGRLAIWSACISGYVDIGKLPFVLADFADGARAAADAHWWNVPLFMELAGLELYRLPSADLIFSDRLYFRRLCLRRFLERPFGLAGNIGIIFDYEFAVCHLLCVLFGVAALSRSWPGALVCDKAAIYRHRWRSIDNSCVPTRNP